MESPITTQQILLYLLYLFGCFSLYQSALLLPARLHGGKFMDYIRKLMERGDISRAIKLSTVASHSPLGVVTKSILTQIGTFRFQSPEAVQQLCRDAFQSEARAFSAKSVMRWLDVLFYSAVVVIYVLFYRVDPLQIEHVILVIPTVFALLVYLSYRGILRDLRQHHTTLASVLPSMPASLEPYR
jgi:hypothetical protein